MNYTRLEMNQFEALSRALEDAGKARVRVGILGNKAERFDEDWNKEHTNNPTIGLVHEFGSKKDNIPARSFLRMPLMLYLPKKLDQIGKAAWRNLVIQKSVPLALKQLGVLGENVVQEAFATGGFGQWPGYSARYGRWKELFTRNKTKTMGMIGPVRLALLVLSGQLRRSVTSRVVLSKTP